MSKFHRTFISTDIQSNPGSDGLACQSWPQDLADEGYQVATQTNSIPFTLEGIAEKTVVDRRHTRVTDRTRRMGIFLRTSDDVQQSVNVRVFGFIKTCSLVGNGDWKGYDLQIKLVCVD